MPGCLNQPGIYFPFPVVIPGLFQRGDQFLVERNIIIVFGNLG
jgi:hypothetical protein